MESNSSDTVKNLLNLFLKPPSGKTPAAIRERLVHWIEVADHPEQFTNGDTSKFAIRDVSRRAKQNLKRLITAHPEVAAQLAAEEQQAQPEVAK